MHYRYQRLFVMLMNDYAVHSFYKELQAYFNESIIFAKNKF